jgi:hypothetical protein
VRNPFQSLFGPKYLSLGFFGERQQMQGGILRGSLGCLFACLDHLGLRAGLGVDLPKCSERECMLGIMENFTSPSSGWLASIYPVYFLGEMLFVRFLDHLLFLTSPSQCRTSDALQG